MMIVRACNLYLVYTYIASHVFTVLYHVEYPSPGPGLLYVRRQILGPVTRAARLTLGLICLVCRHLRGLFHFHRSTVIQYLSPPAMASAIK